MDAKAKVVRWECRPLNWEVQYQQRDDGEWVKFTDHEAALAEERELRIPLESSWQQAEAQLFALIEKHASLLTGLEALAGECEREAKMLAPDDGEGDRTDDVLESFAQRIRTLASAGLEGKVS